MRLVRMIHVNKRCNITREYPVGKLNFEYLNISAVDGDNSNGFVQSVFGFDMEKDCCEYFEVRCDPRIFGEHDVYKIEIYEDEKERDAFDVIGKMMVCVDIGEEEFDWTASNEHNGYYSHEISVEVTEGGRKTFEYVNHY